MTLKDEIETDPMNYGFSGMTNEEVEACLHVKDCFQLIETRIGYGAIMSALGAVEGAGVLDRLETLSATNSPVKWAMKLLAVDNLNIGNLEARAQVDSLVVAGVMSLEQATKLKALAETKVSRAEQLGIVVNDFEVRLARG